MVKNYNKTNNLISSKATILIYNILRDLGLIPTLKGTKILNKAIQIVIKSNDEFIIFEDIYKEIALNYMGFNSVQIRNVIKYAIDTRNEQKSIEAFSTREKYCFEKLNLRRLENGYFTGNEKSKNMQHKLGYKDEGIRRKKYLCLATKEYVDEHVTGLLKEDFINYD